MTELFADDLYTPGLCLMAIGAFTLGWMVITGIRERFRYSPTREALRKLGELINDQGSELP